jgi:hypothetical protein
MVRRSAISASQLPAHQIRGHDVVEAGIDRDADVGVARSPSVAGSDQRARNVVGRSVRSRRRGSRRRRLSEAGKLGEAGGVAVIFACRQAFAIALLGFDRRAGMKDAPRRGAAVDCLQSLIAAERIAGRGEEAAIGTGRCRPAFLARRACCRSRAPARDRRRGSAHRPPMPRLRATARNRRASGHIGGAASAID